MAGIPDDRPTDATMRMRDLAHTQQYGPRQQWTGNYTPPVRKVYTEKKREWWNDPKDWRV